MFGSSLTPKGNNWLSYSQYLPARSVKPGVDGANDNESLTLSALTGVI